MNLSSLEVIAIMLMALASTFVVVACVLYCVWMNIIVCSTHKTVEMMYRKQKEMTLVNKNDVKLEV